MLGDFSAEYAEYAAPVDVTALPSWSVVIATLTVVGDGRRGDVHATAVGEMSDAGVVTRVTSASDDTWTPEKTHAMVWDT